MLSEYASVLGALQHARDAHIAHARHAVDTFAAAADAAAATADAHRTAHLNDARLAASAYLHKFPVGESDVGVCMPVIACVVHDCAAVHAALRASTAVIECVAAPYACAVRGGSGAIMYTHGYTNVVHVDCDATCAWVRLHGVQITFEPAAAPVLYRVACNAAADRDDHTDVELCYGVPPGFTAPISFSFWSAGQLLCSSAATCQPSLHTFMGDHLGTFAVPTGVATFTRSCRMAVDAANEQLAVTTRLQYSKNYVLFQRLSDLNVATTSTLSESCNFRGCTWTSRNTLLLCEDDALYEMDPTGTVQRVVAMPHATSVAFSAQQGLVALGCLSSGGMQKHLLHVFEYPALRQRYSTGKRGTGYESVYIGVCSVAFTPSGEHLAAIDHAHALHLFDALTGVRVHVLSILTSNTISCMCAGFGADELLVLVTQPGSAGNDVIALHTREINQLELDDRVQLRRVSLLPRLGMTATDAADVVAITSTWDRLYMLTKHSVMMWS